MDRPEGCPTMLRRRINELRGGFRRDAENAELLPRRRRGGMDWETREQTCPHEWGHGSLEGCSTAWVTGEKAKNRVAGRARSTRWRGLRAEGAERAGGIPGDDYGG